MIKCRLHIQNENVYMDEEVFIETTLICPPEIEGILYLTEEMQELLESKIKSDKTILTNYIPRYAYQGSYDCEDVEKMNPEDLSLDDAHTICSVKYTPEADYISIELTNS